MKAILLILAAIIFNDDLNWNLFLTQSTYVSRKSLEFIPFSNKFVSTLDSCQLDDQWKFESNNILKIREGIVKCDTSIVLPELTAKWILNQSEESLSIIFDTDTLKTKILSIDNDSLVLRYPFDSNVPRFEILKFYR